MAVASLTELANLYGSDKGTVGPSPGCDTHNYTDIYEAYMQSQRYSAINFIEIGLGVLGDKWDVSRSARDQVFDVCDWHRSYPELVAAAWD